MIVITGDWSWTAANIRDNKNILGAQSLHILIFVQKLEQHKINATFLMVSKILMIGMLLDVMHL